MAADPRITNAVASAACDAIVDLIDAGATPKGGPGSELFSDFLERFWTYDTSPYVREKIAHGHRKRFNQN